MAADTAAELLAEGNRIEAEIASLDDEAKLLPLYLRLKDVVERAEILIQEERS